MQNYFSEFGETEIKILKKLSEPPKIQDFLEKIPVNFGQTLYSPLMVLRKNKAHCIEGALFAAAALLFHGEPPLLLDLAAADHDFDHVLALFKKNGRWGAISKTNHAVLRFREPVYKNIRELAMSYFHEYFDDDGKKNLRSFSAPFNLLKFPDKTWTSSKKNLWSLERALNRSRHFKILKRNEIISLRRADPVEIEAGKLVCYNKNK